MIEVRCYLAMNDYFSCASNSCLQAEKKLERMTAAAGVTSRNGKIISMPGPMRDFYTPEQMAETLRHAHDVMRWSGVSDPYDKSQFEVESTEEEE